MVQVDLDRIIQGIFLNQVPEGITIEIAIGIVITKKKIDIMINVIEIAIAKIMVKMIAATKEKIENAIDIKSVTAIEIVVVIAIVKIMVKMIAAIKEKIYTQFFL